MYVTKLGLYPV